MKTDPREMYVGLQFSLDTSDFMPTHKMGFKDKNLTCIFFISSTPPRARFNWQHIFVVFNIIEPLELYEMRYKNRFSTPIS